MEARRLGNADLNQNPICRGQGPEHLLVSAHDRPSMWEEFLNYYKRWDGFECVELDLRRVIVSLA